MDKDEALNKIGEKIKQIRNEKNMTLQELAYRCDYEKGNMYRIEAGKTNITIKTLLKVSEGLNVKMKDLVDID